MQNHWRSPLDGMHPRAFTLNLGRRKGYGIGHPTFPSLLQIPESFRFMIGAVFIRLGQSVRAQPDGQLISQHFALGTSREWAFFAMPTALFLWVASAFYSPAQSRQK